MQSWLWGQIALISDKNFGGGEPLNELASYEKVELTFHSSKGKQGLDYLVHKFENRESVPSKGLEKTTQDAWKRFQRRIIFLWCKQVFLSLFWICRIQLELKRNEIFESDSVWRTT